jgi:hypothetical protein
MISRPVIGGVFLKALYDPALWTKWAARDQTRTTAWSPFPTRPQVTKLWDTTKPQEWRVATQQPPADWTRPGFDDSAWPSIASPIPWTGKKEPHPQGIKVCEVWMRREFNVPEAALPHVHYWADGDRQNEVYINGVLAVTCGYIPPWDPFKLSPAGYAALKPGRNLVAIHMKLDRDAQAGLVEVSMIGTSSSETPALARPTPEQQAFMDRELGAFLHYDLNVFTGQEHGDGREPASKFNPTALNVEQWVPYSENGARMEAAYQKAGAVFQVIRHPGEGHHAHGLADPTPVVEFIMRHVRR